MLRRVWCWGLESEGSTRTAALLRIGLMLIAWARFGRELGLWTLHTYPEPDLNLAIAVSFWISTILTFLGIGSRASAAWAGITLLGMTIGGAHFGHHDWAHHHTFLLAYAVMLLPLTPCDRSYSVDRWLHVRRATRRGLLITPERANLWGMRLISLQVAVLYFYAAFDKADAAFLSGMRMEQIAMKLYLGSDVPDAAWFHAAMVAASWATVILELALAFGLFFARARPWLLAVAVAFHAVIYVTLPVSTFTVTMWLLLITFLDPDAVHAWIVRGWNGEPLTTPLGSP